MMQPISDTEAVRLNAITDIRLTFNDLDGARLMVRVGGAWIETSGAHARRLLAVLGLVWRANTTGANWLESATDPLTDAELDTPYPVVEDVSP